MFSSLRFKLAISHLSVILLTVSLFGLITYVLLIDFHKQQSFAMLDRSVKNTSIQIKHFFDENGSTVKLVSNSESVRNYSKKFQEIPLLAFLKQFDDTFSSISYIAADGAEEVRYERGEPSANLRNFSSNQLLDSARNSSGKVFHSIKANESGPDTIQFTVAQSNYFTNEILYFIYATISMDTLEKHLAYFSHDQADMLMVIDENKKVLLNPNRHHVGKILQASFSDFGEGSAGELGLNGIYASIKLANPSWRIFKILPISLYHSVYKRYAGVVFSILIVVSLLGLLASLFGARKIIAPLSRLTDLTSQVALRKEAQEVETFNIKELDLLVDSFNQMIRELTSTTITKEYLDNILNSLQEGLFVIDGNGTIESVNQTILDLLAIQEDTLLGQPLSRFIEEDEVYAILRNEKPLPPSGIETNLVPTHNTPLPIQFFLSELFDNDGDKIGYACLALDISHKKKIEAEKESLRYQLHQSQRLESVGTLASGIAHDFNNILTVVIGFSQLLKDKVEGDSIGENALEQILTASYRARDLVKQLLAFSRQEEHKKINIDLGPIAKEILKMLRSSIPAYIALEQKVEEGTHTVFADPSQIQQILMNLCTNSSHAIKQSGTISLAILTAEITENSKPPYENIPPGSYVEIVVSDDGHGIKSHNLDNIFDPFFTTKDVDEGTGLGLSVVHGIVDNLKGHILVKSKENIGTSFRILLPKSDGTTAIPLATADNSEDLLAGRGEHVLFVDDEQSLVELIEKSLKLRGYEVSATTNPQKAYELFKSAPEKFDIVITDFAMPKVKGDELVTKLRKIRPNLPVILCTGYHSKLLGLEETEGVDRVIKKPYTANELIYNITHILQPTGVVS